MSLFFVKHKKMFLDFNFGFQNEMTCPDLAKQ